MENTLKSLCDCVYRLAQVEEVINTSKLSLLEVQSLMELVDVSRKGFLDLSDVYSLVGEVTEEELFAVFKFLDTKRTGEVRVENLQVALGDVESGSKNTSK